MTNDNKFPRDTAKILNVEWDVGAKRFRFDREGKWYPPLTIFPGAYFDCNGYVLFRDMEDFESNCKHKDDSHVHVSGGIKNLKGYIKKFPSATIQSIQNIKEKNLIIGNTEESNRKEEETERQQLIWIRVNHANWVKPVKKAWSNRCAISGVENENLLEACHLKPWAVSDDGERLAVSNGICLAAHFHAALDAHLIGITPSGKVVASKRFSHDDRQKMNFSEGCRVDVTSQRRPYFEYRYNLFRRRNQPAWRDSSTKSE